MSGFKRKEVFGEIFSKNKWGGSESRSGPGSTISQTELLRQRLPVALSRLRIRSIDDAPCGDMNWMKHLDYSFESFIGIDIVHDIIDSLRQQGFPRNYNFQYGDIVTDILPRADAIFCRDCLVHLPFNQIEEASRLWRLAGFRYAFVTTFPERTENIDCHVGEWRPLNMQAAPFNWPEPIFTIPERSPNPADKYADKSIGVWAL